MPLLNADQIVEVKERMKQYQAIGRQDFVQKAMVIGQRGQEHASGWLKALAARRWLREDGSEKRAGTGGEAVRADETDPRARSLDCVNWMVGKLRLALQKGEASTVGGIA
jgi:hypothetical protein